MTMQGEGPGSGITVEQLRQQAPYVGLPTTDKISLCEARLEIGRPQAEWLGCWYYHLYVMASRGGEFGIFSTTVRGFVDSYGGHVPDENHPYHDGWFELCLDSWKVFEKHGIVKIAGEIADSSSRFRVTVVAFGETNSPRRLVSQLSHDVSQLSPGHVPSVPRDKRDIERERKREYRARKKAANLPVLAASAIVDNGTIVPCPSRGTNLTNLDIPPKPPESSEQDWEEVAKILEPHLDGIDNARSKLMQLRCSNDQPVNIARQAATEFAEEVTAGIVIGYPVPWLASACRRIADGRPKPGARQQYGQPVPADLSDDVRRLAEDAAKWEAIMGGGAA